MTTSRTEPPEAEHCRESFALNMVDAFEEDPRPEDMPENVVGAMTFCDGPKGHAGDHAGAIMSGTFVILWSQWSDSLGVRPYKILNRRKDAV